MLKLHLSAQFRKELKREEKRRHDVSPLGEVVKLLQSEAPLPQRYRDHKLSGGEYTGCRECHISPDRLLVYKISDDELYLARTGTHSDLFD